MMFGEVDMFEEQRCSDVSERNCRRLFCPIRSAFVSIGYRRNAVCSATWSAMQCALRYDSKQMHIVAQSVRNHKTHETMRRDKCLSMNSSFDLFRLGRTVMYVVL